MLSMMLVCTQGAEAEAVVQHRSESDHIMVAICSLQSHHKIFFK